MGLFKSLTVRMALAPTHRAWAELVPLIQDGSIRTDRVFTHSFALDDAAEVYATVAARSADCIKALLTP